MCGVRAKQASLLKKGWLLKELDRLVIGNIHRRKRKLGWEGVLCNAEPQQKNSHLYGRRDCRQGVKNINISGVHMPRQIPCGGEGSSGNKVPGKKEKGMGGKDQERDIGKKRGKGSTHLPSMLKILQQFLPVRI